MKSMLISLLIVMMLSVVGAHAIIGNNTNNTLSQTQLFATMEVIGDNDTNYTIQVTVENIGAHPAHRVEVTLEDIPQDWQYVGTSGIKFVEIAAGQSSTAEFYLIKGESDASIYARADGINTEPITTNIVPIPINPLIIGLTVVSILGISLFIIKK